MIVGIIISIAIIVVDQLTKFLCYGMSESIIGDFLWFESTLNTGASFGMLKGGTLLFILISVPMVGLMIWLMVSNKVISNKFFKACLGVMIGGTVGNLIDRIAFGGVRDFIYFKSINFAIFNVADIAITIGTIMLIIFFIVYMFIPHNKTNKKESSNEQKR